MSRQPGTAWELAAWPHERATPLSSMELLTNAWMFMAWKDSRSATCQSVLIMWAATHLAYVAYFSFPCWQYLNSTETDYPLLNRLLFLSVKNALFSRQRIWDTLVLLWIWGCLTTMLLARLWTYRGFKCWGTSTFSLIIVFCCSAFYALWFVLFNLWTWFRSNWVFFPYRWNSWLGLGCMSTVVPPEYISDTQPQPQ